MDVVGIDRSDWQDGHVHTLDVWYSKRRRCWIVERLNHEGRLVGTAHCCATLHDAEACVTHWLRAHDEAHLVAAWQTLGPADQASADVQTGGKVRAAAASINPRRRAA